MPMDEKGNTRPTKFMKSFITRNLLKVRPGRFYNPPHYTGPRMRIWNPDVIIEDGDSWTSGTLVFESMIAGKRYVEIRPHHTYGYYVTREWAKKHREGPYADGY